MNTRNPSLSILDLSFDCFDVSKANLAHPRPIPALQCLGHRILIIESWLPLVPEKYTGKNLKSSLEPSGSRVTTKEPDFGFMRMESPTL